MGRKNIIFKLLLLACFTLAALPVCAESPDQIADTDSDQDGESETCPVRSNQSKLMKQILEVMESSQEIYEPGFQLPRLAELVNSNVGEVSALIDIILQ